MNPNLFPQALRRNVSAWLLWPLLALAWLASAGPTHAQVRPDVPRMQSTTGVVSIQVGERLNKNSWQLSPETNPDVYEVPLPHGKPVTVKFISKVDTLSFVVEDGRSHDFVIQYNGRDCHTRIVGKAFTPPKGLELSFDFAQAQAAARLAQDGDFSSAPTLDALKALPGSAALQRKMRMKSYEQLVDHFREAANNPRRKELASAVVAEFDKKGDAGKYANLAAQVKQALQAYVPADLGVRVRVYFLFGGTSNGFAFGGDDVYVNLAAYVDASAQDLADTVAHEVFHAVQAQVMGSSPSDAADGTGSDTEPVWAQKLLYSLLQEATAEVFTHTVPDPPQTGAAKQQAARIAKNSARLKSIFTMFETLVFRLAYAPPQDADEYDRIYGLMFYNNFDATAYDMGWTMANAIEQRHGKAAVFDLLKHDPKEFILRYQAIAEQDGKLPPFGKAFMELVKQRL